MFQHGEPFPVLAVMQFNRGQFRKVDQERIQDAGIDRANPETRQGHAPTDEAGEEAFAYDGIVGFTKLGFFLIFYYMKPQTGTIYDR